MNKNFFTTASLAAMLALGFNTAAFSGDLSQCVEDTLTKKMTFTWQPFGKGILLDYIFEDPNDCKKVQRSLSDWIAVINDEKEIWGSYTISLTNESHINVCAKTTVDDKDTNKNTKVDVYGYTWIVDGIKKNLLFSSVKEYDCKTSLTAFKFWHDLVDQLVNNKKLTIKQVDKN